MIVLTSICALGLVPLSAENNDPVANAIEDFLQNPRPAGLEERRDFDLLAGHLRRLYAGRDYQPLWLDAGDLTSQGLRLVAWFGRAEEHGLRPGDYLIGPLDPGLPEGFRSGSEAEEAAQIELVISFSTLRFIKDLHEGRFSPKQLELGLDISHRKLDLATELLAVREADDPARAVDAHAPTNDGYWKLKSELARYSALEREVEWIPLDDAVAVKPGDEYSDLDRLRARLTRTGDLPSGPAPASTDYEGEIVEAVTRFQHRHGLDVDGVIGLKTFAQLNVPWSDRVAQITISLERWRWIPDEPEGNPIVVNVPAYVMRGLSIEGSELRTTFHSRVVVGKPFHRYRTPIFSGRIRYLDFRPYWNIPRSIVRDEMSAQLSDAYLDSNDMEIVSRFGHDVKPLPPTPENIASVKSGRLHLRQRPGPNNALGLVKFIFPNEHSVYLHSTPAKNLFKKARRDFSHGCIRVGDPIGLAEWILEDQEGWDRPAIERAMTEGGPTRVRVNRPIPVIIIYMTALVDRTTGLLRFWDDIYGNDAMLAAALGQPLSETIRRRWEAADRGR